LTVRVLVGGLVLIFVEARPHAEELIPTSVTRAKMVRRLLLAEPDGAQRPEAEEGLNPSAAPPQTARGEGKEERENQVVAAVLFGAAGAVIIGLLDHGGRRGNPWPWLSIGALAGWSVGTGLIVCAIGQYSPTRHGGCRGSILGALIGTVGILPGVAMIWKFQQPCTDNGSDPSCSSVDALFTYVGAGLAGLGYVVGTTVGANVGWSVTATRREPSPSAGTSLPILTIRF
jgi:hypothetical protein